MSPSQTDYVGLLEKWALKDVFEISIETMEALYALIGISVSLTGLPYVTTTDLTKAGDVVRLPFFVPFTPADNKYARRGSLRPV